MKPLLITFICVIKMMEEEKLVGKVSLSTLYFPLEMDIEIIKAEKRVRREKSNIKIK